MTRKLHAALWSAATALALVVSSAACDTVYADPIGAPPYTPPVPDASLTSSRNPPVECPRTLEENAPCPLVGGVCETGTSSNPTCNTTFVCASDPVYGPYWTEQKRGHCAATCPDPATIVEGAACDLGDAGADGELLCNAPLGTCGCTIGRDGAHQHARVWVCTKPAEGCPDKRPMLGQPCFGDLTCDYGSCVFANGWRMICADDVWQTEAGQCAD